METIKRSSLLIPSLVLNSNLFLIKNPIISPIIIPASRGFVAIKEEVIVREVKPPIKKKTAINKEINLNLPNRVKSCFLNSITIKDPMIARTPEVEPTTISFGGLRARKTIFPKTTPDKNIKNVFFEEALLSKKYPKRSNGNKEFKKCTTFP